MKDREHQTDYVNSPSHYTVGGIEAIDYIQAKLTPEQFEGYLLGNVIKYVSRHGHKNGYEDLRKAQWYLDRAVHGEEPTPPYNRPKTKPGEIEKALDGSGIGDLERRMDHLVRKWIADWESVSKPIGKSDIPRSGRVTAEDVMGKDA